MAEPTILPSGDCWLNTLVWFPKTDQSWRYPRCGRWQTNTSLKWNRNNDTASILLSMQGPQESTHRRRTYVATALSPMHYQFVFVKSRTCESDLPLQLWPFTIVVHATTWSRRWCQCHRTTALRHQTIRRASGRMKLTNRTCRSVSPRLT